MALDIKGRRARYPSSYKDVKLTAHAIQRAGERLNLTKKEDIKKMASLAKNTGVNLTSIRKETYEKFGLTHAEYSYIKSNFDLRNNSTNIYIYKGFAFIFVGKGKLTLRTIVTLKP